MGTQLYPGIAFSPSAALTDNVGAGDTIIPVSNVEAFPPAPNLATIGTDEEGETVLYAAKTATALSGCTRGVEGTARAWSAGEPIARNWTAKDLGDLITAVEGAAEAAQNTQNALAEHQADDAAHGELFAAKQPKLTGAPGQVVGFNAQGAAQAVQGWSNPNLLDNWYFADPINQRGQTEYIGNAKHVYTLDRWRLAGTSTVSAKLEVVDGGVRITSGNVFSQIVEDSVIRALIGKTVTVSALMDIETPPVAWQIGIVADNVWIGSTPLPKTAGTDILVSATISIGNVSTLIPWIYSDPGGVYKLKAIKLEQGAVQTLAHQNANGNWVLNDPPPNKALELAKCQWYYQPLPQYTRMIVCYVNEDEKRFDAIIAGPPMRIRGTVIHPEYIAQSKSGHVAIYSEQTWQHRVIFYSDNTLPAKGSLVEVQQNGCGISADL